MTTALVREFERAAGGAAHDLAGAALVVARLAYPRLDPRTYLRQLDVMGRTAAGRLRGVDAADLPAVVRTLNAYLFDEEGFRGNETEYDDPRNSFLNEVLERRTGIPITLALVYIEVARRAGVEASGINFPGHFLLRCDAGARHLVLDPFQGGELLSLRDCNRLLRRHLGDEAEFHASLLAPATKRQILRRVLANLKRVYVRQRSFPQARDVTDLILTVDPSGVMELRDRGLLAYHLNDFAAALRDLETYLTLVRASDDDDRDEPRQIWEHVKTLRRRVAGLN